MCIVCTVSEVCSVGSRKEKGKPIRTLFTHPIQTSELLKQKIYIKKRNITIYLISCIKNYIENPSNINKNNKNTKKNNTNQLPIF